jgi:hypothetical protein
MEMKSLNTRQQMKKFIFMLASLAGVAFLAAGCTAFDEAVGRSKNAPDEFQVVVRPPLTLPPGFARRPGDEEDEQRQTTRVTSITGDAVTVSDQVLTSARAADGSIFDAVLGTDDRLADIRNIIDTETLGIQIDRRLPVDILFGGTPNVGPNLNAFEEDRRIRRAREEGKPVNEDPTPATDPVDGTRVNIE